jgi:hypothetical protein
LTCRQLQPERQQERVRCIAAPRNQLHFAALELHRTGNDSAHEKGDSGEFDGLSQLAD